MIQRIQGIREPGQKLSQMNWSRRVGSEVPGSGEVRKATSGKGVEE